jgi:hypothetical protein
VNCWFDSKPSNIVRCGVTNDDECSFSLSSSSSNNDRNSNDGGSDGGHVTIDVTDDKCCSPEEALLIPFVVPEDEGNDEEEEGYEDGGGSLFVSFPKLEHFADVANGANHMITMNFTGEQAVSFLN